MFDFSKNQKIKHVKGKQAFADLDCSNCDIPVLSGDVKIIFYDYDPMSADDKMFHFWFNTRYVERNYLRFQKVVIDKACKDKKCKLFDHNFQVEVFLERTDEAQDLGDIGGFDNDVDSDTDEEA